MWYAQQLVRFPRELLIAYRECIQKELGEQSSPED
jgi:hypothetical protein